MSIILDFEVSRANELMTVSEKVSRINEHVSDGNLLIAYERMCDKPYEYDADVIQKAYDELESRCLL